MKKLKILYVDDEVDALKSMKLGLEDRGYDVSTAENGESAIQKIEKMRPDLIIADLRMSPMDGFELYKRVKSSASFQDVRFFFLTAVDDYMAQKYGQTLGVDAYITKPVDLDSIDEIIKEKFK